MLEAWEHYVKSLIKGTRTKELVDEEQEEFAEYIFNSLMDEGETDDGMLRDSI